MRCICGEVLNGDELERNDDLPFCSIACARTARAQLFTVDHLMTIFALEEEIAELKERNVELRDVKSAVSDYLSIAVDAGDAIARGDYGALRAVAEVRQRMRAALATARKADGQPSSPPPLRVAS